MFLLIIPFLLSACTGPYSTLAPAGPAARMVAALWWGMFTFAALVLLAVVGLWIHAWRRDPGTVEDARAQQIQNRWIIGGGLLLPILSISVLLLFGIPVGHRMLPLAPLEGNALQINVTGHQWWWEVNYPDSGISLVNELHIPANLPVDIHLRTADVIHAFWVPRLNGKLDTIPGRVNVLRLQADAAGIYHGQCAEFCGLQHAHMQFIVQAHSPQDFDAWLEEMQDNE